MFSSCLYIPCFMHCACLLEAKYYVGNIKQYILWVLFYILSNILFVYYLCVLYTLESKFNLVHGMLGKVIGTAFKKKSYGHTQGIWQQFLGHGLNPSHSHDFSKAGSLTCCPGLGIKPSPPQWLRCCSWILNPMCHGGNSGPALKNKNKNKKQTKEI